MDTPIENPEGYKLTSLIENAKKLQSQLLVIEGYQDATVVPQHSLEFLRATEAEGILVDFYTYPTHEHNVRGKDRIHLMKKVTKYFDDFLK
jgi:dipeptidyl-peptidase-4